MSVLSRVAGRLPQVPLPGVTWAVRRLLETSFGGPPLDPHAPRGDEGLFGPGSASWQLFADGASLIGGIRSLLVQLTHPLAMAGVADHSRYVEDPLGRLQHTAAHVALTTYGSTEEALGSLARVRAVHRRVVGTAPDGRAYSASDPELIAWVSVAGTASWLRSDRAFSPSPLDEGQRDEFVAEQAVVAGLLDPRVDLGAVRAGLAAGRALRLPLVEEGWLPTTVSALEERLDWFAPRLAVGEQGRDTLRFLLRPPLEPFLLAGYLPMLGGAIGTLDQRTRRLLGLPVGGRAAAVMRLQAELTLIGLRTAVARPSPSATQASQRLAA